MFLVLLSLYASKSLAKLTNYNSSSSDSDTVFFDELPGFKETFHPELGVGKGPFFARPADAATFILSLAFIPLTLATAFWLHRRQAVQPNLKLAHWLAVFLLITYHILTAIQSGILNRTLLSAAHPPTGIWWKISSYMKPLLRGKIDSLALWRAILGIRTLVVGLWIYMSLWLILMIQEDGSLSSSKPYKNQASKYRYGIALCTIGFGMISGPWVAGRHPGIEFYAPVPKTRLWAEIWVIGAACSCIGCLLTWILAFSNRKRAAQINPISPQHRILTAFTTTIVPLWMLECLVDVATSAVNDWKVETRSKVYVPVLLPLTAALGVATLGTMLALGRTSTQDYQRVETKGFDEI